MNMLSVNNLASAPNVQIVKLERPSVEFHRDFVYFLLYTFQFISEEIIKERGRRKNRNNNG